MMCEGKDTRSFVSTLLKSMRFVCIRRHTLLDECRILLVHGILHLLGFDHEIGAEESIAMAEAERYILNSLHWKVPQKALF